MKDIPTVEEVAETLLQETPRNWSRSGAYALAKHLVEKAKETGQNVDFDPHSIERDFTEWASLYAWVDANLRDNEPVPSIFDPREEEGSERLCDFIDNEGTLIEVNRGSSLIISNNVSL